MRNAAKLFLISIAVLTLPAIAGAQVYAGGDAPREHRVGASYLGVNPDNDAGSESRCSTPRRWVARVSAT